MLEPQRPVESPGRIREFYWRCAGSDKETLLRCPQDQAIHASVGALLLLVSCFSMAAAGFATSIVFYDLNSVFASILAAIVGIAWGLASFHINRLFVCSISKNQSTGRQLFQGLPRFVLAGVIATVIAVPLELKIFEKDIQNRLNLINQSSKSDFFQASRQEADTTIEALEKQLRSLRSELGLEQGILEKMWSGDDPLISSVEEEKELINIAFQLENQKTEEIADLLVAEQAEIRDGGCGRKCNEYRFLRNQRERERLNEAAKQALEQKFNSLNLKITSTISDQKNKVDDIRRAVTSLEEEILGVNLAFIEKANQAAASGTLLERMRALHSLDRTSDDQLDRTAEVALIAIWFVFFFLETSPLLVKTLARPGAYDIRTARALEELASAVREKG